MVECISISLQYFASIPRGTILCVFSLQTCSYFQVDGDSTNQSEDAQTNGMGAAAASNPAEDQLDDGLGEVDEHQHLDEDWIRKYEMLPSMLAMANDGTTTAGGADGTTNLAASSLAEFPSKVLSNLFAVSPKLCDEKFELKINDVRFVGHPLSLEFTPEMQKNYKRKLDTPITMFNVRN